MKRKYTHIKIFESQIIEMREAGKTRQAIADGKRVTAGFSSASWKEVGAKVKYFQKWVTDISYMTRGFNTPHMVILT